MTADRPALIEGVNELQGRVFPSSERRGGCAIKKMLRSLLMKAQTGWSVPDNVSRSTFTLMTTPSAPLRRLRAFFLLAQPPLLFQEGNTLSWQFIHTFQAGGSRLPNPRLRPWLHSHAAPRLRRRESNRPTISSQFLLTLREALHTIPHNFSVEVAAW